MIRSLVFEDILERGIPILESVFVPEGTIYVWDGKLMMHPRTFLLMCGGGRFPFETRHTLGHIEMERDRRLFKNL